MYEDLTNPYQPGDDPALFLGGIMMDNQLIPNGSAHLILKSFNRHGLIAGATGSGKTKTIQVLCEQLSLAGVPSLVMDIKGDVSGLAMPGTLSDALVARGQSLHLNLTPRGFPVEFLTLSESHIGVPLRATVEGFGSVLFSRMLDLNDTQEGVLAVLFEYAKHNKIPLIDLADVKSLLLYAQTDKGKTQIEANYGTVSGASLGTIMRKIVALEAQGGNEFFGEPSFNVLNLLNTTAQGMGVISIVRLLDMQDKPELFSTFMLKLLSDVYRVMPELGDPDKPKLVLFIDEAHLIFRNASKALLSLLDTVVKLIRSKGVGIIFCTQMPDDVPENILSQLGLKIQHALRAFTAKDRTAMKLAAKNFPATTYYDTEQMLTSLGIGEALVTGLDAKGYPTPLIQCMIRPPESRMGVLTEQELQQVMASSTLYPRYSQREQRNSAKEMLAAQSSPEPEQQTNKNPSEKDSSADISGVISAVTKNTLFRQVVRQLVRDWTRSIISALKGKK